ncbi:hypothetical protein BKA67DRAFT_536784 [Truncatella angustata]|uniref:Uncharacterized protein n=1 Tax=Truncatella angustata TaxID=152316 RepID=A0A9P8ZXI5_9PEZI|nr:uncharacterized protein BKA67DRAFT_536784 [Truncatella angustata]KAH6653088.1 hypothetical protein BKA67DRAFT_536784 [Truncatella angustata]
MPKYTAQVPIFPIFPIFLHICPPIVTANRVTQNYHSISWASGHHRACDCVNARGTGLYIFLVHGTHSSHKLGMLLVVKGTGPSQPDINKAVTRDRPKMAGPYWYGLDGIRKRGVDACISRLPQLGTTFGPAQSLEETQVGQMPNSKGPPDAAWQSGNFGGDSRIFGGPTIDTTKWTARFSIQAATAECQSQPLNEYDNGDYVVSCAVGSSTNKQSK